MSIEFNRTNDALPAVRLNDIQFRLELLERTMNHICDDIERWREATQLADKRLADLVELHNSVKGQVQRQRDAWDGR